MDSLTRQEPWTLVVRRKGETKYKGRGGDRELTTMLPGDSHGCDQGSTSEGQELIRVTADSGAADHVAPLNTASHLELQQTEASRQGVNYVAASGHRIVNKGAEENARVNG